MKQKYKLGFLGLRFTTAKGSQKEKVIFKIIYFENFLKRIVFKLFPITHKILHNSELAERFFSRYTRKIKVNINKLDFTFGDFLLSSTAACVAQEINDGQSYVFDNIDFKPGDAVIDIGGNIGIISIYLAKKYPFLKIYSFEPVKCNFDNFLRNIKLNNIPDGIIKVENRAVTKNARKVQINFDPFHTGGSGIIKDISTKHIEILKEVESVTLDSLIENIGIVKLLKIDCEGAEYEILYTAKEENLRKILHLRGEFHENKEKYSQYDIKKLTQYCKKYIDDVDIVECSPKY